MTNDAEFRRIRSDLEQMQQERRQQGLRNLARSVFLDRNAQGMPKKDRLQIRVKARPHLREAIRHARKSRDALLAGNEALHECERDRARMYLAFAKLEFFLPYVDEVSKRYRKLEESASPGGNARAAALYEDKNVEELDDLIRGCLTREDPMRVKEWVEDYGLSKSAIYRRIERIRAE